MEYNFYNTVVATQYLQNLKGLINDSSVYKNELIGDNYFEWPIESWNTLNIFECSPIFESGGCKWSISLHQTGDEYGQDINYLSTSLMLMSGSDISVEFVIAIRNYFDFSLYHANSSAAVYFDGTRKNAFISNFIDKRLLCYPNQNFRMLIENNRATVCIYMRVYQGKIQAALTQSVQTKEPENVSTPAPHANEPEKQESEPKPKPVEKSSSFYTKPVISYTPTSTKKVESPVTSIPSSPIIAGGGGFIPNNYGQQFPSPLSTSTYPSSNEPYQPNLPPVNDNCGFSMPMPVSSNSYDYDCPQPVFGMPSPVGFQSPTQYNSFDSYDSNTTMYNNNIMPKPSSLPPTSNDDDSLNKSTSIPNSHSDSINNSITTISNNATTTVTSNNNTTSNKNDTTATTTTSTVINKDKNDLDKEPKLKTLVSKTLQAVAELNINDKNITYIDVNKDEIFEAVVNNNINKLKEFTKQHANMNVVTPDGWSALHIACQNGNVEVVKILVEGGADINMVCNTWTPTELSCCNNQYPIVKYLIEKGANLNQNTDDEFKLLHMATGEGLVNMMKLLLTDGKIDANAKDPSGWTALHLAAQEGQYEIAKVLIKVGKADVNEEDKNLNTPLHIASQYGNHPITQLLIMNNAKIDFKNLDGMTPLHTACQNGNTDVVRDLLENNNAGVNQTTKDGKTPLHIACESDNKCVVQLLIDNNANIEKTTFDDWTPLHVAVYYSNPDVVKYLLQNNPPLDKKNRDNLSVLDIAHAVNNSVIMDLLSEYISTVEETATTTRSVLMEKLNNADSGDQREDIISKSEILIKEIKEGNTNEAINIIESHEISIEYIDKNGWTALHWACYMNNGEIVKLLIENNVNLKKKTRFGINNSDTFKGKTAKEIATIQGCKDALNILKAKIYKDTAKTAFKIISKTCSVIAG